MAENSQGSITQAPGPGAQVGLGSGVSGNESRSLTVKLDAFEGPLDLLLYLIKREEIDIWNIPIARITEQYLEHLQMMRDLNVNIAGEWLVMAATLIYIKSRMLLPPDPTIADQELVVEDPRRELVYQLLEHQKFKNAAQMLYDRETLALATWSKPRVQEFEGGEPLIRATLFDLIAAFRDVIKRFEQRLIIEYDREDITIEEKMEEIRQLLSLQREVRFSALFSACTSRRHLIVTFLALLELVRLCQIRVMQEKAFGEIIAMRA